MEVVGFLLALFVIGLIIGAPARLIVPGPNPIGPLGTALAGIGGAVAAGLLSRYLIDPKRPDQLPARARLRRGAGLDLGRPRGGVAY
jgi:uncharacterized membrane protein YeaQ/YmgE (transglycosylase-associated protein family)